MDGVHASDLARLPPAIFSCLHPGVQREAREEVVIQFSPYGVMRPPTCAFLARYNTRVVAASFDKVPCAFAGVNKTCCPSGSCTARCITDGWRALIPRSKIRRAASHDPRVSSVHICGDLLVVVSLLGDAGDGAFTPLLDVSV